MKMDFINLIKQCLCHGLLLTYIITDQNEQHKREKQIAPKMSSKLTQRQNGDGNNRQN
jgi:hypothetical protein